jgi:hypothetical protein
LKSFQKHTTDEAETLDGEDEVEDLADDREDPNDVDLAEDEGEVEHGHTDPELFHDEVEETVQSTPTPKVVPSRKEVDINRMRQMFLQKK